MNYRKSVALLVGGALLGAVGTWMVTNKSTSTLSTGQGTNFPLLAQRISIENPNDTIINFSDLRSQLNTFYAEQGRTAGIYFEYLPTGTSIRINANQDFRSASLMKLPVAMEFYRGIEVGKINPKEKVALKEEWLNSDYGDLYKKGAGYEISLEDAARIMLQDSDNTALRVIIDATEGLDIQDRALGALDIEFSQDAGGELNVGARSYSSFLKCLYFACFNTKQHAQTILDILTQTSFNDKIVAGIPADDSITVAHKIGVFNTRLQSDCGIVYLPKRNYVLCIMAEGNADELTDEYFKQLSSIIYHFVKDYKL